MTYRLPLLAVAACAAVGVATVATRRPPVPPPGMVLIPGGEFTMGTADPAGWDDEKPTHRVTVAAFFLDATEVTNARFAEFVAATGYVTTAEKPPDVAEIMAQLPPGTPPPPADKLVPGSLVFTPPPPGPADHPLPWWNWTPGADWRHPEGPGSTTDGRENHPVVQVSWDDANAYAAWAGKRLPTEAEWERAARGGLDRKSFTWGDDRPSDTVHKANIWQGHFPDLNTAADGFARTAPVGSFSPNGYGLSDMAGNVWEWCADWYDRDLYATRRGQKVTDPRGPARSHDPDRPTQPLRVQRGGSFLCHESYCTRYRPSARQGATPDSGAAHVGFRCAK